MDWANRMILGDSLQIMASLARREDLAGKVQMIYLDPPYGIKFASNFQPQLGQRDVKDRERVRCLMDEVFGRDNFITAVAYKTAVGMSGELIDSVYDNLIWFARSKEKMRYNQLLTKVKVGGEGASRYKQVESSISGEPRLMSNSEREEPERLAKE